MFGAYWNYCQISDGVLYYTSLRPTEKEVHSMNKTFKIVFNKARGALMVANELTGSVQKKGTKLVVAATMALLSAGFAEATTVSSLDKIDNMQERATTASEWGGLYLIYKASGEKSGLLGNENSITTSQELYGGLFTLYKAKTTFSDGSFSNNTITSSAIAKSASDAETEKAALLGGVVMIKDGTNTFKDCVFTNNVINSTGKTLAAGGAVYQDAVMNTEDGVLASALTFEISEGKDITYSGNNVTSSDPDTYYGLYGTVSTAAGGFLFLDRTATTEFAIGKDATLHIGTESSTGNMDSIASSLVVQKGLQSEATITKTGQGTLEINSSLDKYYGKVDVKEGTLSVTKKWNITNAVNVSAGAVLQTNSFSLIKSPTEISWNGLDLKEGVEVTVGTNTYSAYATTGALNIAGTLITKIGSVFSDGNNDASLDSTSVTKKDGITFTGPESTLLLTDSGTFSGALYDSVVEKSSAASVNFLNASLAKAAVDTSSDLNIKTDTAVKALEGFNTVTIDESKSLIIQGDSSTTSVDTIELSSADSSLKVVNNSAVNVNKLTGKGEVSIGQADGSGASMTIGELAMTTGTINVDPEYGHSTLQINSIADDTLNANIKAGHGAFVTIGADADTAKNAVSKLNDFDSIQSVLYIAKPVKIGNGNVLVTSEPIGPDIDGGDIDISLLDDASAGTPVTITGNSALVIDQSTVGSSYVISDSNISFEDAGRLGIVNANVGTIVLTNGTVSGLTDEAISTDNPFIQANFDGTRSVVNTMSAEGGLGALASTGIQAMTRRADTVLAQTIADRTSVDQELAAGTNLWVDVTGERYEADKLDNGGEFKSDMGYGAFGADFAVTQDITAGAAFQYGKGSLRSGVSSIKNSIDSYGVTAYGAMKFGEAKVVAEASYIKNKNDITSSQTALNQSVDSEIYSVGVRGQHRFTAGNFQFVPSVGVRVSRLNTDAMQVGAVNIKKQEQTLVQVPIALRVNGFEQNVSGWSVAPSFKVAYVPTFGDKEISVFGADQTVIDTSPVQGDFGIRAQNGNLMVNANMMLGGGKDGTSSVGGKVGLKYVF